MGELPEMPSEPVWDAFNPHRSQVERSNYNEDLAAYWEARCRVAVEKLEGISERPSGYHDCGDYERGYGDGRNAAGAMARVTLAEIGPLPEPTP